MGEKPKKVIEQIANIDENKVKSFNYDNSIPLNENGEEIKFDNKKRDFDSKQYKEDAESRKKKKKIVIKLRERLKNSTCHDTKNIALE